MIGKYVYFGRVETVVIVNEHSTVAYVRPLYERTSPSQSWSLLSDQDVRQGFPPGGLFTWLNAPSHAIKGSVWLLEVERSVNLDTIHAASSSVDAAITTALFPTTEILDLRASKVHSEFSALLQVFKGLELSFYPSRYVYLWIDTQKWVGPVSLQKTEKGLWKLDLKGEDLLLPLVIPSSETDLVPLQIDGQRRFLAADIQPPQSLGFIRKGYSNDHRLQFTLIDMDSDQNLAGKNGSEMTDGEVSFVTPLPTALVQEQRSEPIDVLLHMPAIVALIDEIKQAVRQEAQNLIHAELADMKTKVQAQQMRPTFAWTSSPTESSLTKLNGVYTILRDRFEKQRFSSAVACCLHAAFAADVMPVVMGADAFEILKTYASCITGGRILWVPIAPTMLEPADLLGRVDIASKCFIPHQSRLLDLLLDAADHPSKLYMVVLDGINRAAIDSYLMPILACYRDKWQTEGRRISLFHPQAIVADDPYASNFQIAWPQNILLAGILSEGATAIAPPATLWSYATLICPELEVFKASQKKGTPGQLSLTTHSFSSLSADTWSTWYREIDKNASVSGPDLLDKLDGVSFKLSREGQVLCSKLYTALILSYENNKETASKHLLFQSLLPQAVASHQEAALRQAVPQFSKSIDAAIKVVKEILL